MGSSSVDVDVIDPSLATSTLSSSIAEKKLLEKSEVKEILQVNAEYNIPRTSENVEYPGTLKLAFITVALCLSIFLMALDQTIIATAIPKITDQFKALDDIGWYGSAYLLTTASFQLIFGTFYTYFSIKWTYLVALAIFELGSLICGVAPTSIALIIGRAIAGLGAAGIFSGALIIIAHAVPLQRRPLYTGLVGGMWGVASVTGPLLGGVFTDKVSWRWCFYINLPIGAIAGGFIFMFLDASKGMGSSNDLGLVERMKKFDVVGCVLVVPGVSCLLLALQWGGAKFSWHDSKIIALLVVFSVLISLFVLEQLWMGDSAMVPPRIIKKRSIWSGALFAACIMASFFVLLYFLPIWFQAIKGISAVSSGIRILPMIISVVVATILSGAAVSSMGYYTPFMIATTILVSIGSGLLTTLRVNSGSSIWIGYQFIAGFGVGLSIQLPSMAAQNVLDPADIPVGMVVIGFAQSIGSSLCISVAQNLFTNKLLSGLKNTVPGLDPQIVLNIGATDLKTNIPIEFLPQVLQVYNTTIVDIFFVCVATGCISAIGSLIMEWKSMKRP